MRNPRMSSIVTVTAEVAMSFNDDAAEKALEEKLDRAETERYHRSLYGDAVFEALRRGPGLMFLGGREF